MVMVVWLCCAVAYGFAVVVVAVVVFPIMYGIQRMRTILKRQYKHHTFTPTLARAYPLSK